MGPKLKMPVPNNNNNTNAADEINQEINSVYEYFLAAGLTHEEIVEKAKPLLRPVQIDQWLRGFLTCLKITICCIAVSFTLASDTISQSILFHGRHIMFKVLPFWDWSELYSENCLVNNPFFKNEKIYHVDCGVCEDLYQVDYLNTTNADEISQLYLQRNVPVVVRGAMEDWPVAQDNFDIMNLTEGYLSLNEDVCMFQTNLRVKNHYTLFSRIFTENTKKWYAHWENCFKSTQKLVRQFYNRPYFLPTVVQMTESNWIIMSTGYTGIKFKKIDAVPTVSVMWLAQVWGYNTIRLSPKEPCDLACTPLQDTVLMEGEIVLYNPAVWSLSYLPGDDSDNLAIAAGGFAHFT